MRPNRKRHRPEAIGQRPRRSLATWSPAVHASAISTVPQGRKPWRQDAGRAMEWPAMPVQPVPDVSREGAGPAAEA